MALTLEDVKKYREKKNVGTSSGVESVRAARERLSQGLPAFSQEEQTEAPTKFSSKRILPERGRTRNLNKGKSVIRGVSDPETSKSAKKVGQNPPEKRIDNRNISRDASAAAKQYGVSYTGDAEETLRTAGRAAYGEGKAADAKALFEKADAQKEWKETPSFHSSMLAPASEKQPSGVDNIPVYSGRLHGKYGAGDYLSAAGHGAMGAISGMSNSIVQTAKAFNDLARSGFELVSGLKTTDGLQPLWDLYNRLDQNAQDQVAEDIRTGKMSESTYAIISGLTQQIPTVALAILSGGSSVAAEGASAALGNPSAVEAGIKALPQMFKDPQFLFSFTQTFGPTYQEARENGANPAQAFLAAVVDALPESAIEVGGGLETALAEGPVTGAKDLIGRIGKSALEEAGEEIRQDPFSGLARMTYDPGVNKVSLTDEDAVVNPVRGAKSAFYAFITSALSGGAGTTLRTAQDYHTIGTQVKASGNLNSMLLTAMDSQDETLRDQAADLAYQVKSGKKVSSAAVGKMALQVAEEVNREQTAALQENARQWVERHQEDIKQIDAAETAWEEAWKDPEKRKASLADAEESAQKEQKRNAAAEAARRAAEARQEALRKNAVQRRRAAAEGQQGGKAPASVSMAEQLGENGRKAYEYTLEKSNGEEAGIRPAFLACYTYGLAGSPMENVPEEFKSALSGDAAYRAWASGQNDAAVSLRNDQEKVKFASLAGEDSGLVYDDFVNEAVRSGRSRVDVNEENRTYLSAETAEQINETAKALGLRVQFADSVRGGTANAQISGDTILIEKDNPNPVLAIAGHEFGHRLQELAPEEYRRFRESILEGREQEVRDKAAQYAKQGVNVTYEEAMNEVANDQAGLLMDGGEVLDRFIEQHRSDRTLLQKMRDTIRSFIDKVTGKERKRLETAEGKLEAALKAAAKQAKALQKKAAGDTMGAGKYSLKEDGVGGRENETGRRSEAGGQEGHEETSDREGEERNRRVRREFSASSGRYEGVDPSFGEKPFRTWTEGYVIMPPEGTVSYVEQQTVKEYGVPSFVVSDAAWSRGETKAPAFSVHGQIYLQETIPEKFRGMIAPHEITHVMRQVEFAPYLDFVERTPTMLDMGSAFTQKLLEHTANHQHTTVMDADPVRLYDEFNATLYGHIHSGKMGNLVEPLSHVFYDFDAYAKELTELHERFKAENLNAKKNAGQADGDARYSIKYDESHTPYVEIDEDILRGIPKAAWVKTVKDNLRNKFPNGMTVGQNVIAINKQSRMEMTFSRYMQKLFQSEPQMYADKLRATNNADEIVRAAQNWVNEALLHPRKDDIIDFARGKVLLRIGENDYSAQVIVGNRGKNGLLLYDVINLSKTTIQEKTKTTDTVYTANTQNEPRDRGPVSVNTSIPEKGENVNTNLSLKTGTITKSYEAVLEENRLLREQMKDYRSLKKQNRNLKENRDYWKGQTKTTKEVTTDRKAVEKAAAELLKSYSSEADVSDIQDRLQNLYDSIARGDEGVSYEEAWKRAEAIAKAVIDKAVAKESLGESYQELLSYLKDTKIRVEEDTKSDIPDYSAFQRQQKGRLSLNSQDGTGIDQVYLELAERWPEFFDETEYTNPSDQLLQIADVADQLRQVEEYNPFEGDGMDQVVAGAANEILERFFDLPQTKKTFADRQEAKLNAAKAQGKQQAEKIREGYKARLDKLRQANRQRVADAIDRERGRADQKIRKLKEKYAARDAAGREKREIREYKSKIRKTALDLSRRLLNPTDSRHIPESLRGPVAAFLSSVDFSGKKQDTKAAAVWQDLRNRWEAVAKGQNQDTFSGEYLTIDPELVPRLDELLEKDVPSRLENLSREEAEELWKVTAAIKAAVTAANRSVIEGKKVTAAEAGKNLVLELSQQKQRYLGQNNKSNRVSDFFQYDMTDSTRFGEMFGPTMESLIGNLREGHNVMVRRWNEAVEYTGELFKNKEVWKWGNGYADPKAFKLESGESILLTPAQVMSLYLLDKREQGRRHLYGGGITPTEIQGKHKRYGQGIRTFLTEGDAAHIIGSLTAEQRQVADGIGYFLSHQAAEWGNEASMERFGYRKFTEENYFPIKTDPNYVRGSDSKENRPGTIAGLGMTKELNKAANNPILLEDVFDVFSRHVTEMAAYDAFMNRLEDFQAVWNRQEIRSRSVKEALKAVGGEGANSYIRNLLADINGRASVERSLSEVLLSRYKSGVIGGNLRVALQQPTAYTRALEVMKGKYLLKGLAGKVDAETMKEYAPIARWKDWGYYETGNGKQVKDLILGRHKPGDRFSEGMMALPGFMDSLTWGRLWKACEYEIADTTDLKPKTDEFYRAVGKRFTEVIDKTQVVDSVFHRSQIMRSKNFGNQLVTAFMAEPTKSYNAVMGAVRSLQNAKGPERKKAAVKLVGRAVSAYVVTNVINALVVSLMDAARDDDRDKDYAEKYREALLGEYSKDKSLWDNIRAGLSANLTENLNPLSLIPYLKDTMNLMEGYDIKRMDMQGISELVSSFKKWEKLGDGRYTVAYLLKDTAESLSKLTGIPIGNLMRELSTMANTGISVADSFGADTVELRYRLSRTMYDVKNSQNLGIFTGLIWEARQKGNEELARTIYNDLIRSGWSNEKLDQRLQALAKKALDGSDLVSQYLDAEEKGSASGMEKAAEAAGDRGFSGQEFQAAVNQERNRRKKGSEETDAGQEIQDGYWAGGETEYSYGNLYQAVLNGDSASVSSIRKALEASGKSEKDIDSAVKSRIRADLKDSFWESGSLGDPDVRKFLQLLSEWDSGTDGKDYLEKATWKKWKETYQGGKGEYPEYRKYYDILKKVFGYSNDEIIRMGKDK